MLRNPNPEIVGLIPMSFIVLVGIPGNWSMFTDSGYLLLVFCLFCFDAMKVKGVNT